MLSREAAVAYVQNSLRVDNVEAKLKAGSKLQLLNDVVRGHYNHTPYSNFKIISIDPDERTAIPRKDIIADCMGGRGGTCHVLNTFLNMIFRALGIDAILQGCWMNLAPEVPIHHFVNIIRNLEKPGDLHVVDGGAWYPLFHVVSLHDLDSAPSKTYKSCFSECRFGRKGNFFTRYHKKGSKIAHWLGGEEDDEWRPYYNFDLSPDTSAETLENAITDTYKTRINMSINMPLFAFYPFGRAITLATTSLRIYDEKTKEMKTLEVKSAGEAYDVLSQYNPNLDKKVMERAYENLPVGWQQK